MCRLEVLRAAECIWGEHAKLGKVVADIHAGRSYMNHADDMGAMARLFVDFRNDKPRYARYPNLYTKRVQRKSNGKTEEVEAPVTEPEKVDAGIPETQASAPSETVLN